MKSKKIISLILTAIMVLSIFPMQLMTGWAASGSYASYEVTTNLATQQTITITIKNNGGIKSYYFNNEDTTDELAYTDLTDTKTKTFSQKVDKAETWYLHVLAEDGTPPISKEYTFVKINLKLNGDDYVEAKCDDYANKYIIAMAGTTIQLPTPTRGDYTFMGWSGATFNEDDEVYEYKVGKQNATLTALWDELEGISIKTPFSQLKDNGKYDKNGVPKHNFFYGETIDYTDMVVQAKYSARNEPIKIPLSDCTITITDGNGNKLITDTDDDKSILDETINTIGKHVVHIEYHEKSVDTDEFYTAYKASFINDDEAYNVPYCYNDSKVLGLGYRNSSGSFYTLNVPKITEKDYTVSEWRTLNEAKKAYKTFDEKTDLKELTVDDTALLVYADYFANTYLKVTPDADYAERVNAGQYIPINYKNYVLLGASYSSYTEKLSTTTLNLKGPKALPAGYECVWFMSTSKNYDVKATNRDYANTTSVTWTRVSDYPTFRSDPLSGYDKYEFRAAIVKNGTTILKESDFKYDASTYLGIDSKILISEVNSADSSKTRYVLASGTDSAPSIKVEVRDNILTRLLAFFRTFFGWGQAIKVVSGSSFANKLATFFGGNPTVQICTTN